MVLSAVFMTTLIRGIEMSKLTMENTVPDGMVVGCYIGKEWHPKRREAFPNGYHHRRHEPWLVNAKMVASGAAPCSNHFQSWCEKKGVKASTRQARKFLQAFPRYRGGDN